jgi:hypothetical protein
MNLKSIIYCVMLLVLYGKEGFGQIEDFGWSDFVTAGNSANGKMIGTKYIYSLHNSTNYFFHKDWYEGTLMASDGEAYSEIPLRYDAFNDELVAYNSTVKGLFVVDKFSVDAFTVKTPHNGTQYFRRMSLAELDNKEHYFEIIYSGKVSLVSFHRITEHKISLYTNQFGQPDNREYILAAQCFLLFQDQAALRILPGKRSVLSLFPERKRELRRLLKLNQIEDFSIGGIPKVVELLDKEGYF